MEFGDAVGDAAEAKGGEGVVKNIAFDAAGCADLGFVEIAEKRGAQ